MRELLAQRKARRMIQELFDRARTWSAATDHVAMTGERAAATAVIVTAALWPGSAAAAAGLALLKSPQITHVWLPCISGIFLALGIRPLWRRLDRYMNGDPRDPTDNKPAGRYIGVGLALLVTDIILRAA